MAYATVTQMLERYDARVIGDLVNDDETRDSTAGLATDTALAAALDDASAELEVALLQGGRYSVTDLADNISASSQLYLARLTCDIAMGLIYGRRAYVADNPARDTALDRAEAALELLRSGKHVFNLAANITAGQPEITGPTSAQYNDLNTVRGRCSGHFYPRPMFPNGRN